jgi:hypothetical protein
MTELVTLTDVHDLAEGDLQAFDQELLTEPAA